MDGHQSDKFESSSSLRNIPSTETPDLEARFVIVGGGIAGTSCIEELCFHCPNEQIILITDSDDIKTTTNVTQIARTLSNFDVERKDVSTLPKNVRVVIDGLDTIYSDEKIVKTKHTKQRIKYEFLCLCTGARPKLIDQVNVDNRKYILGLRDTESVIEFEKRIQNSRKIVIVGNGGIAADLVYQLKNVEIEWVIKDKYVSQTFLDAGAATFFKKCFTSSNDSGSTQLQFVEGTSDSQSNRVGSSNSPTPTGPSEHPTGPSDHPNRKRPSNRTNPVEIAGPREAPVLRGFQREDVIRHLKRRHSPDDRRPAMEPLEPLELLKPMEPMDTIEPLEPMETSEQSDSTPKSGGSALGPNWHSLYKLSGQRQENLPATVKIHYETEIQDIAINATTDEFPVKLTLQNGTVIECDFIVSATGVTPNLEFRVEPSAFTIGADGGILVNEFMASSIPDIYAAGDCCTAGWVWSKWWFQMRLWTQARQMGLMAGKSMAFKWYNEEIYQDFCFELFGHVTQLYGVKVILLGLFNGQTLENHTAYVRINPGDEYIKLICDDKKIHGALLIGETDLAEAAENLILDQFDVSTYGETILEPEFDLTEYYD